MHSQDIMYQLLDRADLIFDCSYKALATILLLYFLFGGELKIRK
jgi:hypothetical protein